jgi:hypothetical protein
MRCVKASRVLLFLASVAVFAVGCITDEPDTEELEEQSDELTLGRGSVPERVRAVEGRWARDLYEVEGTEEASPFDVPGSDRMEPTPTPWDPGLAPPPEPDPDPTHDNDKEAMTPTPT